MLNDSLSVMVRMSSWITTRCSQVWNKSRVLGSESFHLATAMWKRGTGETKRDVLFHQARFNGVATSFLKLDREVGLYKYFGLIGYLREKQIGASNPLTRRLLSYGSTNGGDGDPCGKKKNNKNAAKVAFMITSNQRLELSERLGYQSDDIKKLKPVEASLLLANNVTPDEKDAKLGGLIQEYNEELSRQHQQAKLEAEKLQLDEQLQSWSPEMTETETTADEQQKTLLLDEVKQAAMEEAENTDEGTGTGSAKMWYEVVETKVSDGSNIPVALYQDEEEAKLCLELKEGFAERRAQEKKEEPSTTYTIRKTVK